MTKTKTEVLPSSGIEFKIVEVANIGDIGAGNSVILFPQNKKRKVVVPKHFPFSPEQIFTAKVCGNSLAGDGILDGHHLVYRDQFERGEIKPDKVCIVYLHLTGELLARHVLFNKDQVILRSSSPDFPDQYFQPDDIEIRGLVFASQTDR